MVKKEVTVRCPLGVHIVGVKKYLKMDTIKQGNRSTVATTLNVATTHLLKNIHTMHIIPKYA